MHWKEYLKEATKKPKVVDIHTYNLSKLYSDFNRKYFENKLSNIPVILKKLKNAGGITRVSAKRIGRMVLPDSIKVQFIAISTFIETTEERLYGILAHEMCHAWVHMVDGIYKDYGGQHGLNFKRILNTVQKRTPFNVPMTDDTAGLEISGNVKSKQLYVVLRTDIKTNKYYVMLFNKSLSIADLDRLKNNFTWPKDETLGYYNSKEKQLLRFPVKRKMTRSLQFNYIDKDLAELVKKTGKFIDAIHPTEETKKKNKNMEDFFKKHGSNSLLKV